MEREMRDIDGISDVMRIEENGTTVRWGAWFGYDYPFALGRVQGSRQLLSGKGGGAFHQVRPQGSDCLGTVRHRWRRCGDRGWRKQGG